jgi:hypothetical protein
MANAIEQLQSGLTVGHTGLGLRGTTEQRHDGRAAPPTSAPGYRSMADSEDEPEAMEWRDAEIVVKAMSTRPIGTATGEIVVFTQGALEDVAEQVRSGFVPIVIEHLSLLPPAGRWHDAEVVVADDGASELVLRGHPFRTLRPVGADPDPWTLLPPDRPAAATRPSIASIDVEPRNFDPAEFAEARDVAPVPVEEVSRWSALPPLEWVLAIPVGWGMTKFLGSFLDQLGKESARAVVEWIGRLSSRAKDPDRDRIITLQFELPGPDPVGALIYAFIPIEPGADVVGETLPAIDLVAPIAELAGAQAESSVMGALRRAAFIWKNGAWQLAWWVVDEEAVRMTNWFLENEPDVARYLGLPFLDEGPAEGR